jgi:hypothetical protein
VFDPDIDPGMVRPGRRKGLIVAPSEYEHCEYFLAVDLEPKRPEAAFITAIIIER